jgi:RNA polymerase sigma-70 factor (ECF subfamily)
MSSHEEARLIAAARAGDGAAFAELVARHQQALRGFLRRYVGHWGDADDLAQEAFVTAWSRLDRFEARSSFRTWVCGIGYRIARDAKRAHGRAQTRDAEWLETQGEVEQAPIEDRIALAEAMAELPQDQRAVVALCLGEGFSHAEAADALRMPLGTVKSHVTRGRERLLQALKVRDE